LIEGKKNFAFETTCAGHHHIETLKACRAAGYHISLVFYWLPSADMAIQRVKQRVKQGGHNIPEDTIRRRYGAGMKNLIHHYLEMVDNALILDNMQTLQSGGTRVIVEKVEGNKLQIYDASAWQQILKTAE